MQRLWIPGRIVGLNELIDARMSTGTPYGHRGFNSARRWNGYSAIKSDWSDRVRMMVHAQRLQPVESAYFTYLFRELDRRRDPSNIAAGGMKIIEDALKSCGIVANDGWAVVLGFAQYWVVDKANPGTTLFLTDRMVLDRMDAIWRDDNERQKEHERRQR